MAKERVRAMKEPRKKLGEQTETQKIVSEQIVSELKGADPETAQVVEGFFGKNNPTEADKAEVLDAVENSEGLTVGQKYEIIALVFDAFNKIPEDPARLREETIRLANLAKTSYILIGQRIIEVREKGYYKTWGYKTWQQWVETELNISHKTGYKYINMIESFGVEALQKVIQPSKLIPALPLLISPLVPEVDQENIKKTMLEQVDKKSARDIEAECREWKIDYGLAKPKKLEPKTPEEARDWEINQKCKSVREIIEGGGKCMVIEVTENLETLINELVEHYINISKDK